jgi:hypothetical protein
MKPETSINHLPPERMTPEQRRSEIAALLVVGLLRLRESGLPVSPINATDRDIPLGFTATQSVHTNPAIDISRSL